MAHTSSHKKIPVIIDTDPGVDDVLAILLALASPELDIRAIIITFGNTDIEAAYLNIFKLYQAILRQAQVDPETRKRFCNVSAERPIILVKGADGPLEGELHSAQYFHGRDGLSDITNMHPDLNVANVGADSWPQLILSDQSGVDVALDIIKSEPARSVTYIVLGPMTTLAHLHRKHGDVLRDRIGRILCMGGALDVPGNTNAVAEFNFFADPYAVRELLTPDPPTIGLPLDRFLLVPLDITTPHEIPFPFYQTYIDKNFLSTKRPSNPDEKLPITHFTSSFLERTREVMILFGKDAMELHDIVVVWCAINNPPEGERVVPDESALPALQTGWAAAPRKFQIERLGELTRGMLVVDRRQAEGAYDPGANRALIQADIEKHGFTYAGVLESAAIPAQVEIEQPPSDVLRLAGPGVPVVTTTPGPAALLELLSERVWGVTV